MEFEIKLNFSEISGGGAAAPSVPPYICPWLAKFLEVKFKLTIKKLR